ncbi:MAG: hypothetical protein WC708_10890 [Lentisphaeria bacterium]
MDSVQKIGIACGLLSVVIGFCLPRGEFKLRLRLSPLFLQVALMPCLLIPSLHGTPGEAMIPTLLTFVWAGFAFQRCWRFYRLPSGISRGLAVALYVEGVAFVLLAALDYGKSCLFFHQGLFSWS